MTAREGLDDARSAAEAWADGKGLELLGVVAIEPFKRINYTSDDGQDSGEFITHFDGNPGDGRAPGWVYGFYTGDRCVTIVLAAGLGVLAEGYDTCEEDVQPLGDWAVDSDEVAEILAGHEEWPDLGDDATYFWGLFGDEEAGAMWVVEGSDQDGTTVEAVVDAQSGDIIEITQDEGSGFFGADEQVPVEAGKVGPGQDGMTPVHDEASAALVAGDSLTATIDLLGSGGYLVANANVRANVNGVGAVRIVLTGPDGVIDAEPVSNFAGGDAQFEYGNLPPGTYTLAVEPAIGAVAVQADVVLDGAWS